MPFAVTLAGILMLFGKKNYFQAFLTGAYEGLKTTIRLLPTLIALLTAISMLQASGAVLWLSDLLAPFANKIGIPSELLPFLLTRPFSGSASAAACSDLLVREGADSFAGLCASVIFGSSDTVVYVISVYTSSVGIKKNTSCFSVCVCRNAFLHLFFLLFMPFLFFLKNCRQILFQETGKFLEDRCI